jgi:hypothetical protein
LHGSQFGWELLNLQHSALLGFILQGLHEGC